jgi:spermidine/putrescine transport system substrate-binding protein
MTKSILRNAFLSLAAAATAALLCACGPKKPVLHIFTWSDYMAEGVVERFEKDHNCKVKIVTFDSNESMLAKLNAGATGYDLIFPSSYMVKIMNEKGMLMPLNHDLIPNLKNIDPAYSRLLLDKEMHHSVPYAVTISGLGYLDSVPDVVPSWSMLDRADLKGRMTLLNDYREVIGAALKSLGYSANSTDDAQLAEAKNVVLRWKKNIAKFDNEQYKNGLASGEFYLTHGYSGDIKLVQDEAEAVRFLVPAEGSLISCDDMVIPVTAPEPELAHAFINAVLEPQNAADLTQEIYYLCPNAASYELLPEDFRTDPVFFPPEDVVAKLEMIDYLGSNDAKYTKIWDEIKAAD